MINFLRFTLTAQCISNLRVNVNPFFFIKCCMYCRILSYYFSEKGEKNERSGPYFAKK